MSFMKLSALQYGQIKDNFGWTYELGKGDL